MQEATKQGTQQALLNNLLRDGIAQPCGNAFSPLVDSHIFDMWWVQLASVMTTMPFNSPQCWTSIDLSPHNLSSKESQIGMQLSSIGTRRTRVTGFNLLGGKTEQHATFFSIFRASTKMPHGRSRHCPPPVHQDDNRANPQYCGCNLAPFQLS